MKKRILAVIFALVVSLGLFAPSASADAKRGTVVRAESLINHPDDYGSLIRCVEGDYQPILEDLAACEIDGGEHLDVKVFTKDFIGLPEKEMIYKITAHNNNSSYICVDRGAIERGYAATVEEVILSEEEKIEDVCTTVNGVGDTQTKALVTAEERADGMYLVFENTGREDWEGYDSDYPYSTTIKVDFDKIP